MNMKPMTRMAFHAPTDDTKGKNFSMSRILTTLVNAALDLLLIFLIYILIKLFILKEAKKPIIYHIKPWMK